MTIKKILVPTDFSLPARAAIDAARELARPFGARLDLLHVWELPPIGAQEWTVLNVGGPPMAVRDFVRRQAALQMERLAAEVQAEGLDFKVRLEEGNASRVIVELAEKEKYDLIVMSTHGRTGLEHFFVGSVTEKVVRQAPCPVMVLRPEHVPA